MVKKPLVANRLLGAIFVGLALVSDAGATSYLVVDSSILIKKKAVNRSENQVYIADEFNRQASTTLAEIIGKHMNIQSGDSIVSIGSKYAGKRLWVGDERGPTEILPMPLTSTSHVENPFYGNVINYIYQDGKSEDFYFQIYLGKKPERFSHLATIADGSCSRPTVYLTIDGSIDLYSDEYKTTIDRRNKRAVGVGLFTALLSAAISGGQNTTYSVSTELMPSTELIVRLVTTHSSCDLQNFFLIRESGSDALTKVVKELENILSSAGVNVKTTT